MANDLAIFKAPALPAHIQDFFNSDEGSNIADRQSVPSLTYGGKKWAINLNGEKTILEKRDADGDLVPAAIFRAIILGYAPRRGRAYYEGAYDPDKPGKPACWSDDGITPHPSVVDAPSKKCDTCPWSQKGSKVSDNNKAVTACSQHRMVAVIPSNDLSFTPLRLKLAITSIYDGQSPELEAAGWFAFDNYTEYLRTKGIKHTGALVTKLKFDPKTDYPKVIFSPEKWLEPADLAIVAKLSKSPEVLKLLSGTWSPEGADGHKVLEAPAAAPVVAQKKPKAPVEDDEDAPVLPPKKKPAPVEDDEDAPVVVKKKKPVVVEDDEDAPAKPVKPVATPQNVEALLGEWDDD